jgi:hypothetical protein
VVAHRVQNTSIVKTLTRLLAIGTLLSCSLSTAAQARFPTAQAATDAFIDAIATSDDDAMARVLGKNYRTYIPQKADQDDIFAFLGAWSQQHRTLTDDSGRAWLEVGTTHWRLPIPIVQSGNAWHFDTIAGGAEIRQRQIGRNELGAIDTLRMLQRAQLSYMQSQGQYAQRLVSRPDMHDGLYWPTSDDGIASPLDSIALAMTPDTPVNAAYFGYRFKIMPAPSSSGFSIIAWPAVHGVTGVHTFMLDEDAAIGQRSARTVQPDAILKSEWRPLGVQ